MKVLVIPEELMLPRFFPIESIISAKRIWNNIKIDYTTKKHIGFTVEDKIVNTKHSVIYLSEKKFPDCWNCDCQWYSIRKKYCKHILAVNIFLQRMKDILPFEVEFVNKQELEKSFLT